MKRNEIWVILAPLKLKSHLNENRGIFSILFGRGKHSVGFYPKYCRFWPTFRDEIDESFLRFFSLTLILLDLILLVDVEFGKMNETTEKMFTSSLRPQNLKSGNISGKI